MQEVYKIKSITNFNGESIEERAKWINTNILIEHLEVGYRACFRKLVESVNGFKHTTPARFINTSGVEHIQQIDGGYLVGTYSGTCYELQRVLL